MGVINPAIWGSQLTVNVHNLCRGLQTVITAVLTVTHCCSFMMVYDDNMMQMIMISDFVGFKWELKHNLIVLDNKILTY